MLVCQFRHSGLRHIISYKPDLHPILKHSLERHFLAWKLCPASALPRITRLLHNDYGLAREELLACLMQAQSEFQAMGLNIEDLKRAEEFLRRGPPLGTLPNRTALRPGAHRDRVDLEEKAILGLAKDWVKAIEERE